MTEIDKSPIDQNAYPISPEDLFNFLSIFFISTLLLFITILLMIIRFTLPLVGSVWQFTFPVFLGGYLALFINIVIYYSTRLSKFLRIKYQKYERTVKILALLFILILIIMIGSILSVNNDTTIKIIGTGLIVFVALAFIIMEPVIAPIRKRLDDWINRNKNKRS